MIDHVLIDALLVLFRQFYSTVLQCGARLPTHIINYWTVQSVMPVFKLVVCLSVTFLIVDLWLYCVSCTRSGVTRRTLLVLLNLDPMCQCGLHAVLWSHISIRAVSL